jgi:iron complex outermembrane receptor protein
MNTSAPLFKRLLTLVFLSGLFNVYAQNSDSQSVDKLLPDSTINLGQVTIEGYRLSSYLRTFPGNLAVLKGEGLALSDGTNLATTLNTIPGVSMQSGTYATNRIVIRGMGSRTPYNTNRIRSYLNDVPLTSSDGVSAPEEIDPQSLGRIEVIRGPS